MNSESAARFKGLYHHWYAVAFSHELKGELLTKKLLGSSLVLFRDAQGKAQALLNHCLHRGFPLSESSLKNGKIHCGYHGWCFNGEGKCEKVPGIARDFLPKGNVPKFAVQEEQGLIWIYGMPNVEPAIDLPVLNLPQANSYGIGYLNLGVVKTHFSNIIENFMDSMHPPFVHPGLLNNDVKRTLIKLKLKQFPGGFEGQYEGESFPEDSLVAKLFIKSGSSDIKHVERFFAPSIHQFEYQTDNGTHILSTQYCTPCDEEHTQLLIHYHFDLKKIPHWLARLPAKLLLRKLIGQDFVALEKLPSEKLKQELPRVSTELDYLGLAFEHWLKQLQLEIPSQEVKVKERNYEMMI